MGHAVELLLSKLPTKLKPFHLWLSEVIPLPEQMMRQWRFTDITDICAQDVHHLP